MRTVSRPDPDRRISVLVPVGGPVLVFPDGTSQILEGGLRVSSSGRNGTQKSGFAAPVRGVQAPVQSADLAIVPILPPREIPAPFGYAVFSQPSQASERIVETPVATTVRAAAYWEQDGERFYITDWDWARYRGAEIPPKWISIHEAKPDAREPFGPPGGEDRFSGSPLAVRQSLDRVDPTLHGVEPINPPQKLQMPRGYVMLSEPSLKSAPITPKDPAAPVMAAAYRDTDEGRFYIPDYSWAAYWSRGVSLVWVRVNEN